MGKKHTKTYGKDPQLLQTGRKSKRITPGVRNLLLIALVLLAAAEVPLSSPSALAVIRMALEGFSRMKSASFLLCFGRAFFLWVHVKETACIYQPLGL